MVSYQKWTSIVFDVVEEQGGTDDDVTDVIQVGAEVWRDEKSRLDTATVAEAQDVARREIVVK